MNDLVYPRERTLGAITLVLGLIVWAVLVIGTFGGALIALGVGFVFYLFAHSALIAHIKGNGVELTPQQFPDLYAQFNACCERLKIETRPHAYIVDGSGGLNAFATQFLGAQFVVLHSTVVDAMDKHEDGVRFYIGHELGHLRMKHLSGHLLRWPVLWLPLLGAAYSRARESTCDRHGLACSSSPEGAVRALAALAAGSERWKQLDVAAYLRQAQASGGFWMSFHELTSGYPWLNKRAARVMNTEAPVPPRNSLAYLLALFVPYFGRIGGAFSLLIMVYIIGIMAAVALPAYQDYTTRAKLNRVVSESQEIREKLGSFYQTNKKVPELLADADVPSALPDGSQLTLDAEMVLTIDTAQGVLIFSPNVEEDGHVTWVCTNGEGLKPNQLPSSCR